MNITHKIILDMQENSKRQTIFVKQGDSMSRSAEITLYNGGTAWNIPTDETILQIAYYKPDRTGGVYDTMPDGTAACTYSENVVAARLHPQMFTVSGIVVCELRFLDNNGTQLSTFSWFMSVAEAATNKISSEDYFNFVSLNELRKDIGELSDLETNAKDSLVAAINECYSKRIIPVAAQSLNGFSYTASGEQLPTVMPGSGGTHVGKGTQIIFIPNATNSVAETTLQINNGPAVPIRRRANTAEQVGEGINATLPIPAGALICGVPYTMTFCGLYWLLDSYVPFDGTGGVDAAQLQEALNAALQKAKESGEFDGEKGDKGDDYVLTEEDKAEIAAQAANTATTAATEAATTAATEAAVTQVAQEQAQFAAGIDLGAPITRKMLDGDGAIKDIGNGKVFVIEVPVVPGAVYHIRASNGGSYALYAITDASGAVIEKERAGTGAWNIYKAIEKLITMPENAATLRISYNLEADIAGHIWYGYPSVGSRFAGKKWTTIGDSLTQKNDCSYLNYHDYIAAELGLVVTNKGIGGSGYKKRETEELGKYAFYQRVQGISTDADIVTIMGGANDVNLTTVEIGNVTDTGTDTICGCINTTLDNVINLFLNAGKVPKIGVITSPPLRTQLPSIPDCRLAQISDAVIEICRLRSIPCLDLFRKSNLHPDLEAFRNLVYTKDVKEDGTLEGVHPNEIGHRMMASIIRPFIETLL